MKRIILSLLSLMLVVMLSGCGGTANLSSSDYRGSPMAMMEQAEPGRKLVWRADLTIEVANVSKAMAQAMEIARQSGGYVERQSDSGVEAAYCTIRVPSESLKPALASLETIGKVTGQSISSDDVTEQYVDVDARLKTMITLRDRLLELLGKADEVKDILAIESELGRIQGEIDSMQARLKALDGQIDLATISLSIERKRILGPLGVVFKGAWWGVKKLFVLQD